MFSNRGFFFSRERVYLRKCSKKVRRACHRSKHDPIFDLLSYKIQHSNTTRAGEKNSGPRSPLPFPLFFRELTPPSSFPLPPPKTLPSSLFLSPTLKLSSILVAPLPPLFLASHHSFRKIGRSREERKRKGWTRSHPTTTNATTPEKRCSPKKERDLPNGRRDEQSQANGQC